MVELKKVVQGIRSVFGRVSWPSWDETKFTTIMVVVVAIIMAAYFIIVDRLIYKTLVFILGH